MTIHSSVAVRGVPNARAMDGKPMFTIEASSVVMKIATHTSATTGAPVAIRFTPETPCLSASILTPTCEAWSASQTNGADGEKLRQSHFGSSHFSATSCERDHIGYGDCGSFHSLDAFMRRRSSAMVLDHLQSVGRVNPPASFLGVL